MIHVFAFILFSFALSCAISICLSIGHTMFVDFIPIIIIYIGHLGMTGASLRKFDDNCCL